MDSTARVAEYVMNSVSPDYFAAMGTPILRGRALGDGDREGTALVAVVSESMARLLWKGRDAVGECFRVGADSNPCRQVVGVARDIVRGDLRGGDRLQFYLPEAQSDPASGLFVRTAGEARAAAEPVRRELQRLAPGATYVDVRPMELVLSPALRPWQLGASMFGLFGMLALLLAAIGLYGVIAYNLTQRVHELGVRVALGARRGNILGLAVVQGLAVAAAGAGAGVTIAVVAGRWLEHLLFGVTARDPLVLSGAVATIAVAALAASLVPAARAARVDPLVARRSE
jgi:hypothetical protein